jgi:hypothetical protein
MTSYFSEARQHPDDSFFVIPIRKVLPEEDENSLRQANTESADTDLKRPKAHLRVSVSIAVVGTV